tara:strand:+ start:279 stop:500 length:222 start_codon:yes stop_codon:yes gene_type:complete
MNNPKKRMNTLSICTSLTQCDESTEEQGGFVVVTPKKKDALEMLPDIEGGKMYKRTLKLGALKVVLYAVTQEH